MRVSIIIPVYNEATTVGAVIDKVRALDLDKEIIIVDDGSRDGTREALARFAGVEGIKVHHSPVNLGKGASLRIGFSLATGDVVTVQDADLELDPEELRRLVQPIFAGEADVVYGSRFLGGGLLGAKKGRWTFYLANRALSTLASALYGVKLTDIETCYKVFRREVLAQLTLRASRFEIEPELTAQVLKHGYRILELPIGYNPRSKAEGKKISWKDGFAAVAMLVTQRMEK